MELCDNPKISLLEIAPNNYHIWVSIRGATIECDITVQEMAKLCKNLDEFLGELDRE